MKRFLIFAFSLLALCYMPLSAHGALEDAIEATCRIKLPAGNGMSGVGTGCAFEIRDGEVRILTNYHVAEGAPRVQVEFWHQGHQSTVLAGASRWFSYHATAHRDICVVAVPVEAFGGYLPKIMPLAPRGTVLVAGQAITSCGCEEGRWPSAWRGHVVDYADQSAVRFNPKAIPGRSGSAIFDEDCEQIVGLIAWHDGTYGVAMTSEELYRAFDGQAAAEFVGLAENGTQTNTARIAPKPTSAPVDIMDLPPVDYQARRCIHGRLFAQFCPECPSGGCTPFGCPPRQGQPRQPQQPRQPGTGNGGVYPTLPPNPNTNPAPAQPAAPPAQPPIDTSQFALKSELADLQKQIDALTGLKPQVNAHGAILDGLLGKLKELESGHNTLSGDVQQLAQTAGQDALEKLKQDAIAGAAGKILPEVEKLGGVVAAAAEAKAVGLGLGLLPAALTGGPIGVGLLGGLWLISRRLGKNKKTNGAKGNAGGSGGAAPNPFRPSANHYGTNGPTG